MSAAVSFLKGVTTHRRRVPFDRAFTYKVTMIDLDVDRLDEADRASRWFSIDRPNALSFRRKDHGPRDGSDLRTWAEEKFASVGVSAKSAGLRLITFPRSLFYKFAPLSLWFALDQQGKPEGVIYEVHNTFGESHAYVSALSAEKSRHTAPKAFHVSPFFGVDGNYSFNLKKVENLLDLVIENSVGDAVTHTASLKLKASKFSDASVGRFLLTSPLASLGVIMSIHFEALQIFRRGAKYHSRPPLPASSQTPTHDLNEQLAKVGP